VSVRKVRATGWGEKFRGLRRKKRRMQEIREQRERDGWIRESH
jgi:hypothetical protein